MSSISPESAVRLTIALFGAGCLAAQPLEAQDLEIDFQKTYYDVVGSTWPEVWQSIRSSGITIGETGETFEGVTTFSVALRPASGCTAANATVAMTLVVAVPGLPRSTRLSAKGQQCWAQYERWLADHEEWHVQIAVRDAKELIAAVRSSGNASCGDLQRLAISRLTEMKTTQATYDSVTRHGLEQWKAYQLSEDPDPERRELAAECAALAEQS